MSPEKLDYREISDKFNRACEILAKISKYTESLKASHDNRTKAKSYYDIAFVHPEIKELAKYNPGKKVSDGIRDSLLDAYIPDTVPANPMNNPIVKVLEDYRAGFILTIANGQRMGEGRDVADSSQGVEQFSKQADLLIDRIDTPDKNGKYLYSTATKLDMRDLNPESIPGFEPDSLFGYTPEGGKEGFVQVDGKTWEYLKTLEHWFFFAMSNPAGVDLSPDTVTVKASVEKLIELTASLASDPDVASFANKATELYGDASVGNADLDIGQLKSSPSQTLAMLLTSEVAASTAGKRVIEVAPEESGTVEAALAKLAKARGEYNSASKKENLPALTKIPAGRIADIVRDLYRTSDGNEAASELSMKVSLGTPASLSLLNLARSAYNSSDKASAAAKLPAIVGTIIESPRYMELFGVDAENIHPSDDQAAARQIEGEGREADRITGSMNDIKPPFSHVRDAMSSLTQVDETSHAKNAETPLYMISPDADTDVTGAYILPKYQVPLFTTRFTVPSADTKVEGELAKECTVLATYAVIALSDPRFGQGNGWVKVTTAGEGEDTTRTVEFDHADGIEFNTMAREINEYLARLAMNPEPAVAVNTRNDFVSTITNDASWEPIAEKLDDYIKWRAGTMAGHLSSKDETALDAILKDTYGEIGAVRKHIMRFIFQIKDNSRDYRFGDTVSVLQASPLSPFNLERLGRLRLSGGADQTVTHIGRNTIDNTQGKVDSVTEGSRGQTFKVSMDLVRDSVTETVEDSARENWIPSGLFITKDTDGNGNVYALWVGLEFCTHQYEEGNENTLKYDTGLIEPGNESFRASLSNTATPLNVGGGIEPGLDKFSSRFPSLTGNTIGAAADAIDRLQPVAGDAELVISTIKKAEIEAGNIDKRIDSRNADLRKTNAQRANFGQEPLPDIPAADARKKFIEAMPTVGELKGGTNAIAGAAGRLANTMVKSILEFWEVSTSNRSDEYRVSFDIGNVDSVEAIIEFCRAGDTQASRTDRARSAFEGLLASPEGEEGIRMLNLTFSVSTEGGNLAISETEGSTTEYSSPAIDELADTMDYFLDSLQYDGNDDAAARDFAEAMALLTKLKMAYVDSCIYSLESSNVGKDSVITKQNLANDVKLLNDINSDSFVTAFVHVATAMLSGMGDDPELDNASVLTLFNLVGKTADVKTYGDVDALGLKNAISSRDNAAREAVADIRMMKPTVPDADSYNAGFAKGGADRLDRDVEPAVDDIGERDDHSGDAIYSSIDQDAVASLDTSTEADYSSVCGGHTMLGAIKCDPHGMYSVTGTADITAGISPAEFDALVKALDSSRDELENHRKATIGSASGTAIHEYVNSKDYILDSAIDSFYNFFASYKPLGARNPEHEGTYVLNGFKSVVDKRQDISLSESMQEDLKNLSAAVGHVQSGDSDAVDPATRAVAVARYLSTVFANVVLHLESLRKTVSEPTQDVDLSRVSNPVTRSEADSYMVSTSPVKGKGDGMALGRSKASLTKEEASKYYDDTVRWLSDSPELTHILSTMYSGLGLDQTVNPEGAIYPFGDITEKARKKAKNFTRYIYSNMAKTQLASAILYAITVDESNAEGGYDAVGDLVGRLLGENGVQVPVSLPGYVLGGIDQKTASRQVTVTFSLDGKAIAGNDSQAFGGMGDIYRAAGISPSGGSEGSVDDLVRDMRVSMTKDRLAPGNSGEGYSITDTIRKISGSFDKGSHDKEIADFSRKMLDAARSIKGGEGEFVPMSTIYLCTDSNAINIANSIELGNASQERITAQDSAMAARIMRDTFAAGELSANADVQGNVERFRSAIEDKTAEIVRSLEDGAETGTAFSYTAIGTPCSDDVRKTLADIMGEDVALAYVNNVVDYYRAHGKRHPSGTGLQTPGDTLRTVQVILSGFGGGDIDRDRAVKLLTLILGSSSAGTANSLLDRFSAAMDEAGLDSDSPSNRLVNLASRVVLGEFGKNGELFNHLLEKFPDHPGLSEIASRRKMRGTSPIIDVKRVDGEEGAEYLFKKTEKALLAISGGEGDSEAAKEFLSGDLRYRAKPEEYVKTLNEIWEAITALGSRTADGIAAAMAIRSTPENPSDAQRRRLANSHAKVSAFRCGTGGPLSTDNAGDKRKMFIGILADALKTVKTRLSGETGGKTVFDEDENVYLGADGRQIAGVINGIAARRLQWSPNDSDEQLAATLEANRDDSVLAADLDELRKAMAHDYAWCTETYPDNVIPAVNAATKFRGVGGSDRLGRAEASRLLASLADIPSSPVKNLDSDMYGDEYHYRINGTPVTDNEAFVIINSALDRYMDKVSGGERPDSDALMSEDFAECVRLSAPLSKDYPMSDEGITRIVFRTLSKMGLLKPGVDGEHVEFRNRVASRATANRPAINRWFVFDVTVPAAMNAVRRAMDSKEVTNSGNDWKSCADEVARYTARENRARNAGLSEGTKNMLWTLVAATRKLLAEDCRDKVVALDAAKLSSLLSSAEPVDLGGGLLVRPSKPDEESGAITGDARMPEDMAGSVDREENAPEPRWTVDDDPNWEPEEPEA